MVTKMERAMTGRGDAAARHNAELITASKIAAATIAILLIAATLLWQVAHHFAMPVQDDIFDRLRFYRALSGPPLGLLDYFIMPHNEHRIATTRLVTDFDEIVFSGREYTQIIVTNILQILSCWIVYRYVFRRNIGADWGVAQKAFVFATTLLLFINPNLYYTLIVPFQIQHAIMALLVIVAALLVSRASDHILSIAELSRLIIGLILIAVVATFTLGNAPAILIAVAASAIVLRWQPGFIVILGALAVAHTAAVLATTTSVGDQSHSIAQIAKFSLLYWGSPFLRFGPWPATEITWWTSAGLAAFFGAIVVATPVVFGLWRLFKPGLGGPVAVFGFVILVVVIATATAAGLSRAQFGILEAANKKYASFAALGWLGVLSVAVGVARQRFALWRQPETIVFALLFVVLLPLSTSGYLRETRVWQKMIDRNRESSLAVLLHINIRDRLNDIYNDGPGLAEYVGYVEPKDRGIFATFPFRWGDDVKSLLAKRSETSCRSEVQTLKPIPTTDLTDVFHDPGIAMSISGWTWMDRPHVPPETIIAVDTEDRIVGAAQPTRRSVLAEERLGQKLDMDAGWYGFARMVAPPPVRFLALASDGKHFCSLGEVGSLR